MLPFQVQLIHFNQELYGNLSAASRGPNGLAILSLFVNVSPGKSLGEGGAGCPEWSLRRRGACARGSRGGPDSWVLGKEGTGGSGFWISASLPRTPTQVAGSSNPFLSRLLNRDTITRISYKSKSLVHQWGAGGAVCAQDGSSGGALLFTPARRSPADDAYFLQDLSLELLFPESFGFITYQGSLSTPPCSETVTWILIDRALNITSLQVTLCALQPLSPGQPVPWPGPPPWASLTRLPSSFLVRDRWEGQTTFGGGLGPSKTPPTRSRGGASPATIRPDRSIFTLSFPPPPTADALPETPEPESSVPDLPEPQR